ncbi:hypothetical protein RI367_002166 [Sorochytrium milnesiophthora]
MATAHLSDEDVSRSVALASTAIVATTTALPTVFTAGLMLATEQGAQEYLHRKHIACLDASSSSVPTPASAGLACLPATRSNSSNNSATTCRSSLAMTRLRLPRADKRGLFGVSLAEQCATSSLPFVCPAAAASGSAVRLPVMAAVFLGCLLQHPSLHDKPMLFRETVGSVDCAGVLVEQDLFLRDYVDERLCGKGGDDIYGESRDALKDADTTFKLWLCMLPGGVISGDVLSVCRDAFMPYARQAERGEFRFGSTLPRGVVTELRLLVQLLGREERTLLCALVHTCVEVAQHRGAQPIVFARLLAPCLVRVGQTSELMMAEVFVAFLLVAAEQCGDMFDAVPAWVISSARSLEQEQQHRDNVSTVRTADTETTPDVTASVPNMAPASVADLVVAVPVHAHSDGDMSTALSHPAAVDKHDKHDDDYDMLPLADSKLSVHTSQRLYDLQRSTSPRPHPCTRQSCRQTAVTAPGAAATRTSRVRRILAKVRGKKRTGRVQPEQGAKHHH